MSARRVLACLALIVVLVVVYVVVQALRPVGGPTTSTALRTTYTVKGTPLTIPLASGTETTVLLSGGGSIASLGGHVPRPIASITKIMTSMVVLADHPLAAGAQGPSITVTAADVATYERDKADGDSVVAVTAGEKLTEYQALEALLLPSADNIADLLATWDAGGDSAFVAKMNARAHMLNMSDTHYTGPSGVQPTTVSSATDEAHLAELAMANPVFAQIVAMPQVELPVAGLQYNVDADVGRDGIDGVKTGWVPAGGASFVFSARHSIDGHKETVIGAIVGEQAIPALPHVLSEAESLSELVASKLEVVHVLDSGTVVGMVSGPSGATDPVVTKGSATFVAWPGAVLTTAVHFDADLTATLASGTRVGTVTVRFGSATTTLPIVTTGSLAAPTFGWRLSRL